MSLRGYRIIGGIALSGVTLCAPDAPPHLFTYLLSSAHLPLDAPATQLFLWQWLIIATFWAGGLLVGRAGGKAAPDAKRDATIRQLSEAASSFAAANAQWKEQFGRLAAERDELAVRNAELTAERDTLCSQLGQARAALARGPAFPRKFIQLFKHPVLIKALKVALHPDKSKNEVERKQREAMTKLFLDFLDYLARQEASDFSKAG